MANETHVRLLLSGVHEWNSWRTTNSGVIPNLERADLRRAHLGGANLSGANLRKADGREADLFHADLTGADLTGCVLRDANLRSTRFVGATLDYANLSRVVLWKADFTGAHMHMADLWGSDLSDAAFCNAHLTEARFRGSMLVRTDLSGADISRSLVYGCAVWDANLIGTKQTDLVITPDAERQKWHGADRMEPRGPVIAVDNLEVAQFVYLLMHNEKIRNVIDTIGQKSVLILGRFTPDRKQVLDGLRTRLRELGFVPIMFDFDRPTQRDFTETIKTLAGLSRFIIADITNPRSSPLELQAIVPDYMIPLVPILEEGEKPFGMFRDLQQKYGDWVLDVLQYDSKESLLQALEDAVVGPALKCSERLLLKKAEGIRVTHVREYL